MSRILAINGSYREDGITDQAVDVMVEALRGAGAEVEVILLREYPIEFCLNCRQCTQQPGRAPAQCIQHDDMRGLIEKIEQADGLILASPTNFGSVTALFKRFMERLVAYAYWPWGKAAPRLRKAGTTRKKAILVSSSAAPAFLGRWLFSTRRQLKMTAQTVGAAPVGTLFTGQIAGQARAELPLDARRRAQTLARRLA